MQNNIRKIVIYGVFISLALVISYFEMLINISIGVPGAKIGLANGVTMIMLCLIGWKEASIVSIFRIVLSGILFGNLFAILYSLAGASFSLVLMMLVKKCKFSVTSISIVGGISHNIGQIILACFLIENSRLLLYLPILTLAGCISGFCIGILSGILIKHMNNWDIKENFM